MSLLLKRIYACIKNRENQKRFYIYHENRAAAKLITYCFFSRTIWMLIQNIKTETDSLPTLLAIIVAVLAVFIEHVNGVDVKKNGHTSALIINIVLVTAVIFLACIFAFYSITLSILAIYYYCVFFTITFYTILILVSAYCCLAWGVNKWSADGETVYREDITNDDSKDTFLKEARKF